MKKTLLVAVLVIAGLGFYATPYIALYNMQQAAEAHDAAALNQFIDYPAVKDSLKQSMNNEMSKALLQHKTDSGMNAFASMFASAFVNPLIDVIVTPENMAMMLRAKTPSALDQDDKSTPKSAEESSNANDVISTKGYRGFDNFVVTVATVEQPNSVFSFTFARQGLVHWQLKSLAIPSLAK